MPCYCNVHPHVINPTAALLWMFLLFACMHLKEEFDRSAEGVPRSCFFKLQVVVLPDYDYRFGVLVKDVFFVEMFSPPKANMNMKKHHLKMYLIELMIF